MFNEIKLEVILKEKVLFLLLRKSVGFCGEQIFKGSF